MKENLTVGSLIEILEQFPKGLPVLCIRLNDHGLEEANTVELAHWDAYKEQYPDGFIILDSVK